MAEKEKLADYEVELERMRQQLKSLRRKDRRHGKINYSSLDTDALSGEEMIPDAAAFNVEDIAIRNILREKLHIGLLQLPPDENELVQAIFFEELTERQFTERTGIPQKTVNDRKQRALAKLRKFIENRK